MQLILERLPRLDEIAAVFSISLILIHLRAYLITFNAIPAYLKRMSFWDMLGIVAYVQVVALLEAFLLLMMVLFVNFTLPKNLFREKFVSQGAIFVTATFLWIIPIHYQEKIITALYGNLATYYALVGVWAILYFVLLIVLSILLRKYSKFEKSVQTIMERIQPLAAIYLVIDILYIAVIIVRLIT